MRMIFAVRKSLQTQLLYLALKSRTTQFPESRVVLRVVLQFAVQNVFPFVQSHFSRMIPALAPHLVKNLEAFATFSLPMGQAANRVSFRLL